MTAADLARECPSLAAHVKAHAKDPGAAAMGVRLMAYDLLKLAERLAAKKRRGK